MISHNCAGKQQERILLASNKALYRHAPLQHAAYASASPTSNRAETNSAHRPPQMQTTRPVLSSSLLFFLSPPFPECASPIARAP